LKVLKKTKNEFFAATLKVFPVESKINIESFKTFLLQKQL